MQNPYREMFHLTCLIAQTGSCLAPRQ